MAGPNDPFRRLDCTFSRRPPHVLRGNESLDEFPKASLFRGLKDTALRNLSQFMICRTPRPLQTPDEPGDVIR